MKEKLYGFVFKHGEDDYSYACELGISKEDEEKISEILSRYTNCGWSVRGSKNAIINEFSAKRSFIVSWFADGYNGTFNYLVVATDIEEAKEIWKEFIEHNDSLAYSWEKAERGVKNHYGGYITWKDNGVCDKDVGCYELPYNKWNVGSDHLWD